MHPELFYHSRNFNHQVSNQILSAAFGFGGHLQNVLRGSELQQHFDDGRVSVPDSIVEWRVIFIAWCVQQGSSCGQHLNNSQVTQVTCLMLRGKKEVMVILRHTLHQIQHN